MSIWTSWLIMLYVHHIVLCQFAPFCNDQFILAGFFFFINQWPMTSQEAQNSPQCLCCHSWVRARARRGPGKGQARYTALAVSTGRTLQHLGGETCTPVTHNCYCCRKFTHSHRLAITCLPDEQHWRRLRVAVPGFMLHHHGGSFSLDYNPPKPLIKPRSAASSFSNI